ncbi:Outer membrane protein [Alteromonadaceae bacterium Bs31]|nr:Outer membrane protein [Alteromonadaceae bacterium Bs31]
MRKLVATCCLLCCSSALLAAEESNKATENKAKKESPWLLTPTFSSDPKMGNSLGAMAGYLKKFDEKSPSSMFGVMGSYSDTDSTIYGLFARSYFNQDKQRLSAGVIRAKIENGYEDFLGTGFNALTTDDLGITFIRYTARVMKHWFVGGQFVAMDYEISGRDNATQSILDALDLTGFYSNGLGAVLERDTRNNQNSPSAGSLLSINNTAFREALGGDEDFDGYSAKYLNFFGHGNGHVLAARISGRWTDGAPPSGYSSVDLRGYTRGEYLAPHSTTIEIEERLSLRGKFGVNAFVGAACLYGDKASCDDEKNWFPAAGLGLSYMLKVEEKMVVRAELAVGKNDNNGFYIQFGNAF